MPASERSQTEKCPKCSQDMYPVNYAYSSGIIIDKCNDHGVWLDKGELEKVQINSEH